jgi:hypothetical protein
VDISVSIGIILSVVHFILVLWIVYHICSSKEHVWPNLWLLFFWIDLPFGLVSIAFFKLTKRKITIPWLSYPFNDFENFILPSVFFGIGGTVWWFFIPQFIAKAFSNLRIVDWVVAHGKSCNLFTFFFLCA